MSISLDIFSKVMPFSCRLVCALNQMLIFETKIQVEIDNCYVIDFNTTQVSATHVARCFSLNNVTVTSKITSSISA